MEVYVGVHVGTGRIHALSLAEDGRVLHVAQVPTPVGSDGVGPVHEASALEQLVAHAVDEAVGAVHSARLAGLAITSFGDEGFLLDRAGKVLYPAIAWYDRRPSRAQARWLERHPEEEVYARTGLRPDVRRPLLQWLWMLDERPAALRDAAHYLSVSEYLACRLTGEMASVPAQAARTLVFDVAQGRYISEWIRDAELWKDVMPPLRPQGSALGPLRAKSLPGTGRVPGATVALAGYDRAVAPLALGQGMPGTAVDVADRLEHISLPRDARVPDPGSRVLGLEFGPGGPEGRSVVTAFLRTERSLEAWERVFGRNREMLERMAERAAPGGRGIRFDPLGLPTDREGGPGPGRALEPLARCNPSRPTLGTLSNLPLDVDAACLWRALLEGWAFEVRNTLIAMERTTGTRVHRMHVLSEQRLSLLTLRIRSSVLGIPVHVLEVPNAPALGAAMLAAKAKGVEWAQAADPQPKANRVLRVDPEPEWLERYRDRDGLAVPMHPESQPA